MKAQFNRFISPGRVRRVAVLGVAGIALAACGSGTPPSGPGTTPSVISSPNCSPCAVGTVTDPSGNPLAGATIYIVPDGIAGESDGTSQPDGTYSIRVDQPDRNYTIHAYYEKDWEGHRYRMGLEARSGALLHFRGSDGIRVDWQWKLTGTLPNADPSDRAATWGVPVEVHLDNPNNANIDAGLKAGTVISVTLEPRGLIDGSPGQTIKQDFELTEDTSFLTGVIGIVSDVPVGNYTASATINGGSAVVDECSLPCLRPRYVERTDFSVSPNANAIRPYVNRHGNGMRLYVFPPA